MVVVFFSYTFFIRENRRQPKNNTLNNSQNYTMIKNVTNVMKYILKVITICIGICLVALKYEERREKNEQTIIINK